MGPRNMVGQLLKIRMNDKTPEVRRILQYDELQWYRFLAITHKQCLETKRLFPTITHTWKHVPAHRRVEMYKNISEEFQKEGLRPLPQDAFVWRMNRLFRPDSNIPPEWKDSRVGRPPGRPKKEAAERSNEPPSGS